MKHLIKSALGVLASVCISTAAFAKDYKIAVTDIQGMDALISEWGPFKEALEQATGTHSTFFP